MRSGVPRAGDTAAARGYSRVEGRRLTAQAGHSAPWESRRGGRFGVKPDAPARGNPSVPWGGSWVKAGLDDLSSTWTSDLAAQRAESRSPAGHDHQVPIGLAGAWG